MMDAFRFIGAALFGWRWVVLVDYQGTRHVRRIKFIAGRPYAAKYGYHIGDSALLDNGQVSGPIYVKRWEPYPLFAERQWPIFAPALSQPEGDGR